MLCIVTIDIADHTVEIPINRAFDWAVVLSDKMWRAGKTQDRDNKVYTTGAKDEDGVAHCLL